MDWEYNIHIDEEQTETMQDGEHQRADCKSRGRNKVVAEPQKEAAQPKKAEERKIS